MKTYHLSHLLWPRNTTDNSHHIHTTVIMSYYILTTERFIALFDDIRGNGEFEEDSKPKYGLSESLWVELVTCFARVEEILDGECDGNIEDAKEEFCSVLFDVGGNDATRSLPITRFLDMYGLTFNCYLGVIDSEDVRYQALTGKLQLTPENFKLLYPDPSVNRIKPCLPLSVPARPGDLVAELTAANSHIQSRRSYKSMMGDQGFSKKSILKAIKTTADEKNIKLDFFLIKDMHFYTQSMNVASTVPLPGFGVRAHNDLKKYTKDFASDLYFWGTKFDMKKGFLIDLYYKVMSITGNKVAQEICEESKGQYMKSALKPVSPVVHTPVIHPQAPPKRSVIPVQPPSVPLPVRPDNLSSRLDKMIGDINQMLLHNNVDSYTRGLVVGSLHAHIDKIKKEEK